MVLTFSIIQLDVYICLHSLKRGNCGLKNFRGLAVVVSIGRKPRDNTDLVGGGGAIVVE